MLDASIARIVVVGDPLLAAIFAHQTNRLGADDVLRRREVIGNQYDAIRIGRTGGAHALHLFDGDRSADIVDQNDIGTDHRNFPGASLAGHGMRRVYFLCHGLTHHVSLAARFTNRRFCIIKAESPLRRD